MGSPLARHVDHQLMIDMNEAQVRSVTQVRRILEGTQELEFRAVEDDEGRYWWIDEILRRLCYRQQGRADRVRYWLTYSA